MRPIARRERDLRLALAQPPSLSRDCRQHDALLFYLHWITIAEIRFGIEQHAGWSFREQLETSLDGHIFLARAPVRKLGRAKMFRDPAESDFKSVVTRKKSMIRRLPMRTMALALLTAATVMAKVIPALAQIAGETICGPNVNRPASITVEDASREAVRCLINAERARARLRELSVNSRLTRAADGHAEEAARLRWWREDANSHENPETGSTPNERIIDAQYCARQPRRTAEITYTGSGDVSTPAAAVNWWMNISTEGHKDRVLDPDVREIGVGVSEIVADPDLALQDNMGTYVVNFGDCHIIELPLPGPEPVAPQPVSQESVAVVFIKTHVNKCPETGICDWKLTCSIDGQPGKELIGMEEGGDGKDITGPSAGGSGNPRPLGTLKRDGGLPIIVTCEVRERDGPFLFFDSAVWEVVGTKTVTFNESSREAKDEEMRINQNSDEGDVTVHLRVEQIGTIQTGVTTGHPPLAPIGCAADMGRCGVVSFQCDPPLPAGEIIVRGGGIRVLRVASDIGLVFAEYSGEGDPVVQVCASNNAGVSCGSRIAVTLGATSCPRPVVPPRDCPEGTSRCFGGACRAFCDDWPE